MAPLTTLTLRCFSYCAVQFTTGFLTASGKTRTSPIITKMCTRFAKSGMDHHASVQSQVHEHPVAHPGHLVAGRSPMTWWIYHECWHHHSEGHRQVTRLRIFHFGQHDPKTRDRSSFTGTSSSATHHTGDAVITLTCASCTFAADPGRRARGALPLNDALRSPLR